MIDYHFNTQILFAQKESEKKKINMNFTSYFLISFKHLKKIYIKCKYIHVIEKKTDDEMWETKVDVDWKKAKIKSPHIVFLNDHARSLYRYHLSLAILWYFLTHKVCWYSLPIHLYSNSPWQLANKSKLFFQYFRSAHMSYLAVNMIILFIHVLPP